MTFDYNAFYHLKYILKSMQKYIFRARPEHQSNSTYFLLDQYIASKNFGPDRNIC